MDPFSGVMASSVARVSTPLFSIVLATRNSEVRLGPLLASLSSQDPSVAFELVIADSTSMDGTLARIEKLLPSPLSSLASSADNGIYDAWNRAIPSLCGLWTLFLGDDDAIASPDALHLAAQSIMSFNCNPIPDIVLFAGFLKSGKSIFPRYSPKTLWRGMRFAHPASLIRTSVLKQHSFDSSYRIAGDYAFFLAHPELRVARIPDITLTRIGAGGISQTKLGLLAREVYRALRSNGYSRLKSSYYPSRILLKALLRRLWR